MKKINILFAFAAILMCVGCQCAAVYVDIDRDEHRRASEGDTGNQEVISIQPNTDGCGKMTIFAGLKIKSNDV